MDKIDTKQSPIYKYNSRCDLSQCVLFLGKKGYFSDYEDFRQYAVGTLYEVKCREGGYIYPFARKCKEDEGEFEIVCYKYFIPESKVVFIDGEPKKYRPFKSIDEFSNETGCEVLGEDFITIRNKNTQKEYVLLFVGYSDDEVHLGGYILTFGDLLKNYEFLIDEWQQFGIEE